LRRAFASAAACQPGPLRCAGAGESLAQCIVCPTSQDDRRPRGGDDGRPTARGGGDQTPAFGLLVHHTDAAREWAYDRDSHVGRLDKALTEAGQRGWLVVNMQADWKRVYPGPGR
jgi:hypothetical protein